MEHKFNTTLTGDRVSYFSINEYLGISELLDIDYVSKTSEIRWVATPEITSNGISEYDTSITDIMVILKVKVSKDFLEPRDVDALLSAEFTEKEYEYFKDVEIFTTLSEWVIHNDLERPMVSNVSIDFEEGTITVS